MRIPYVIDNIEYGLADVLNYLLQREHGQQVDIATAYFSIRGFEQVRKTLPGVRHFRLLLGDKPLEGEDIGLRPDSAAYLRHELNAEPFTEATLRLVEELVRFLRRDDVDVRLYLGHAPNETTAITSCTPSVTSFTVAVAASPPCSIICSPSLALLAVAISRVQASSATVS